MERRPAKKRRAPRAPAVPVEEMSLEQLSAEIQRLEGARRHHERLRDDASRELARLYEAYTGGLRRLEADAGLFGVAARRPPTQMEQILAVLPATHAEVVERTGIKASVVSTLLGRLQKPGGPVRKVGAVPMSGMPNRTVTVYGLTDDRPAPRGLQAWPAPLAQQRDEWWTALERRDVSGDPEG